ncbi:hypothetical protein HY970_03610 [Candidatus Kaiserbacteria bacterium]|nr:hypothetical protein [Candidatus Kaiserbacteria bacterium]
MKTKPTASYSALYGAGFGIVFVVCAPFVWNMYISPSLAFSREATSTPERTASVKPLQRVEHIATPKAVKAIYMSQCVVGTPTFRDELVKLIDTTELNAVVIDIRDYTGKIAFPTDSPLIKDYVSDQCGAHDMRSFVEELHKKNIYVIGRITVFQNPAYTKNHPEEAVQHVNGGVWKDRKGLAFVDVGARPYWETVVELSKESYALGFDELNFDYIRFPSDGDMKAAVYSWDLGKTKQEALEEFFKYLHDELKSTGVILSADLFGYVTVHADDLGIGQILERAMPYFDYIDPMVYPSHYNSGFAGLKDVNSDPYKVVHVSLVGAVKRAQATTTELYSFAETAIASTSPQLYSKQAYPASKIRPWLQSFDYPVSYTPEMVRTQIKANEDAGVNSYLFWDPANKYRSLRAVLLSE